jgi:2,4-dienoyl-CoA reductase-like NADH-dependent reductase (Old Yellow Enzyme family)
MTENKLIDHYNEGGAAVVTVGDAIVHSTTGKSHPRHVLVDSDRCIPSLVLCAEGIHQYNAMASIELNHGGICCDPAFIGGRRPIGPSSLPVSIGFQTEHSVETVSEEMTEEQIQEIADAFGKAAARVKKAGFDMCVIHASHGWLINQFLSPYTNRRTDKYGGSIENRCRFPIMVINSIRKEKPISITTGFLAIQRIRMAI